MHAAKTNHLLRLIALGCFAVSLVLGVHNAQHNDAADQRHMPITNSCESLFALRATMSELEAAVAAENAQAIIVNGTAAIDTVANTIGLTYAFSPVQAALLNPAGISPTALHDALEARKVQIEAEITNQTRISGCATDQVETPTTLYGSVASG